MIYGLVSGKQFSTLSQVGAAIVVDCVWSYSGPNSDQGKRSSSGQQAEVVGKLVSLGAN